MAQAALRLEGGQLVYPPKPEWTQEYQDTLFYGDVCRMHRQGRSQRSIQREIESYNAALGQARFDYEQLTDKQYYDIQQLTDYFNTYGCD